MRKTARRSPGRKPIRRRKRAAPKRWSAEVASRSNALDLERGVFTWNDPRRIATSLKRSAEISRRRKTDAYRSAMSMLTFYLNRAGAKLPKARKNLLARAKAELRKAFGRGDA